MSNSANESVIRVSQLLPTDHYSALYKFEPIIKSNVSDSHPILVPKTVARSIVAATHAVQVATGTIITAIALAVPIGLTAIAVHNVSESSIVSTIDNQEVPHTTLDMKSS